MKKHPLVSILLPVYNNEVFLPSCIESLSSQSYQNIEIIAIDDASKDDSYAILKETRKKDRRFFVSRNIKRYGLTITLNRAVKRARGKLITFASPNDISAKDRIAKQVAFLLAHPKLAALGTQSTVINKHGKTIGKSNFPLTNDDIRPMLLGGISIQPETVMVRRNALPKDAIRFRSPSYPLLYTEVFARCMQYSQFANLPLTLYKHRKTSYTSVRTIHILPSLFRSWVEAATFSQGERLPLRSLFFPLLPRSTT